MLLIVRRSASCRYACHSLCNGTVGFSTFVPRRVDPRLKELGKVIEDEYSTLRDRYGRSLLLSACFSQCWTHEANVVQMHPKIP
jgi:hypothetical protein